MVDRWRQEERKHVQSPKNSFSCLVNIRASFWLRVDTPRSTVEDSLVFATTQYFEYDFFPFGIAARNLVETPARSLLVVLLQLIGIPKSLCLTINFSLSNMQCDSPKKRNTANINITNNKQPIT